MTERAFSTDFWGDPFIQDLPPEGKLLMAYLKTSPHANQAGLYKITVSTISFDTGLDRSSVIKTLPSLSPNVEWYQEESLVWVKGFLPEQAKSPKFITAALSNMKNGRIPEEIADEFMEYNTNLLQRENLEPQVSLSKRDCVIIRDNFTCQYCRHPLSPSDPPLMYELDHINPKSKGGKDNYLNLAASCARCNQKKGDRTPSEAGLIAPKVSTFHVAQAIYLLKNSPALQEKWKLFFPGKPLDSLLINVNQRYSMLNQDTPSHARASDLTCSDLSLSDSVSDNSLFSGSLFSLADLEASLNELPQGVDKLAQHEAIKQRLADFARSLGFTPASEYRLGNDRIDMCWLSPQGQVLAAFEIDYRTPRENSIEKLKRLGCPRSYILLRKDGLRFIPLSADAIPTSESEKGESLSPGDRAVIATWCSVANFSMPKGAAKELVARMRTEFADVDILRESKLWAARKLEEPLTPESRLSSQLWHWMEKAREINQRPQRPQRPYSRKKIRNTWKICRQCGWKGKTPEDYCPVCHAKGAEVRLEVDYLSGEHSGLIRH